jgi:Tfp pilus assembly protein PilO
MTRSRLWNFGTIGVVLVVFLAGWFLLISPKQSDAATLREDAETAADANEATEAQIRELEAAQKNLPQQNAAIEEIAQLIPATPQLPELIRQLTDAGANASVQVTGITPGPITSVPSVSGVVYIPLALNATGTFADVKSFLYELQMNKRAMLITDISVRRADVAVEEGAAPGPNLLTVDVTARVYMTKEAAAAANSAAAGSGATPAATPAATGAASATPAATPAATAN